jgi:MSHA biogenesis protein MshP
MSPLPIFRPRGAALVKALFLLVMIGLLAAFMVTMSLSQRATSTKSLISTRAYYGAKAGLDWGIQQAVAAGSCAASTTLNLAGTGLAGVSVTVTCAASEHAAGSGNFVYYLTSVATTGTLGGPGYAERRMQATVSNIP